MISVARLKELEKKATKGPWPMENIEHLWRVFVLSKPSHDAYDLLDFRRIEDAQFVSEIRAALPDIIRVLEAGDALYSAMRLADWKRYGASGKSLEEFQSNTEAVFDVLHPLMDRYEDARKAVGSGSDRTKGE